MIDILKLIVFLPLFGSLFAALFRKSQLVTTAGIGISAVLSWYVFLTFSENYHLSLFSLFSLSVLIVNWAISLDALSSLMLIVLIYSYDFGSKNILQIMQQLKHLL